MKIATTSSSELYVATVYVESHAREKICHWNFDPENFGPWANFSLKISIRGIYNIFPRKYPRIRYLYLWFKFAPDHVLAPQNVKPFIPIATYLYYGVY